MKARHMTTEHPTGVVEYENALSVDHEYMINWLERLNENEPDEYTVNEDGNYVNRGGYIFTKEQIGWSPKRYLNLATSEEDEQFVKGMDANIHECLVNYLIQYPEAQGSVWWKSPLHLVVYEDGQFMGSHSDNQLEPASGNVANNEHPLNNSISASVILLTDCEGGELNFAHSNISLKPNVGSVIMYPSNYIGAHEVVPVKGLRVSAVQFFCHGTPKGDVVPDKWYKDMEGDIQTLLHSAEAES